MLSSSGTPSLNLYYNKSVINNAYTSHVHWINKNNLAALAILYHNFSIYFGIVDVIAILNYKYFH